MWRRVWTTITPTAAHGGVRGGALSSAWVRHMSRKKAQDFKTGQPPSRKQARLLIRQKRADTKKALKGLLFHYGDQGTTFENDEPWKLHGTKNCDIDSTKKRRSNTESLRAEKIQNQRMKRKFRKESAAGEDVDYPETRWYKWAYDSFNGKSRGSTPKFDWRDAFRRTTSSGEDERHTANETDSEDEACNVGLCKDRVVLGLSPNGPLKIKDVKNAFHLLALKWHPDKHRGPTQAAAEEKFKACANAYKSLCSALSET